MMGTERIDKTGKLWQGSSFRDQYIFGDTIGSGGFGKVKLATHILTKEKVAIKIIDKKAIGEDLPRVKTELKALTDLCHQHICRLFQAVETEEKFYFVLEFCAGGELFDYIVRKECLPEPEARHFFRQIVSAIAYVHNQGFAHRDLKPENLLLTEDLQLKLIDFGLCAKPEAGLQNVLETCCGSPAYAAPELVLGRTYLGNEADIWSMGVLLYALLCGFLPFEDDNNIQNLYAKISVGKYTEPPWLTQASKDLLKSMLQVDPHRRIKIDELLVHPWVAADYSQPLKCRTIYDKNLVDEECAQELGNYYRIPKDDIMRRIKRWDYDSVTATYFLLLARKKRRCPIMLPLPPRSSPNKHLFPEPADLLHSPTIHASLESGMDQCANNENDGIHSAFAYPDRKPPISKENSYSRAINHGDEAGVTPVSRKIKKKVGDKENFVSPSPRREVSASRVVKPRRHQHQTDDALANRPKSVYTTPGVPRNRRVLKENNEAPASLETPINVPHRRSHSVDNNIDEDESGKERTPRSKTKTPGGSSKSRRMFASVERKMDKVFNLLTPKRTRDDGPARLNRTKQTLVNVSSTSCKDPHLVLEELLRVFNDKGITCENHGWKIDGKAKDRHGRTKLTLQLEVVYVEHLETIGIKRKRLNGDSFMYKKVCEDILGLTGLGLSSAAQH